jgi:transcriptional regulator with XRE-family HTH domain
LPQATTLSDRLAAALKATNLKQADLVKLTGLDKGYLSRIVKGEKAPSRRVVADLARALGVRVEWLRDGTGEMRAGAVVVAEGVAPYAGRGSWIIALRPALVGSPLEDALPVHTLDVQDTDRAWAELEDDRKREVLAVLRSMASVAILAERSLPQSIAVRLNDELANLVNAYLADAF